MATESARAIFERRAAQRHDERLRGLVGTYRFNVEGVGSWRVAINDGAVQVTEGDTPADCIVTCDETDFIRIAEGQQNLITAAMQGRVRVTGDYALAQKLHGLVRSGQESRSGAAAQ
jgi:putative sterol carrier protein